MQNNEQSNENASSRSKTARRTNSSKRCLHDIESLLDEDNDEKNFPDLRLLLYTTYLERPIKNNADREILSISTVSRLGRQPQSAVISGQPAVRGRALQTNTHKKC